MRKKVILTVLLLALIVLSVTFYKVYVYGTNLVSFSKAVRKQIGAIEKIEYGSVLHTGSAYRADYSWEGTTYTEDGVSTRGAGETHKKCESQVNFTEELNKNLQETLFEPAPKNIDIVQGTGYIFMNSAGNKIPLMIIPVVKDREKSLYDSYLGFCIPKLDCGIDLEESNPTETFYPDIKAKDLIVVKFHSLTLKLSHGCD